MLKALYVAVILCAGLFLAYFPDAESVTERDAAGREDSVRVCPTEGSSWFAAVSEAIAEEEYAVSVQERGLHSPNRAQNLRVHYTKETVEVAPRVPGLIDWEWRWSTAVWGRHDNLLSVKEVSPDFSGNRVFYDRGGFVEWYVNNQHGLEQGFTIAAAPDGSGPLQIFGYANTGLLPVLSEDQRSVDYRDTSGSTLLRYGGLYVQDANKKELDASLNVSGGLLTIVIDDTDARYPIEVDPLLSSPSWTDEGDQEWASFGFSTATAGDVNGDGFSDVIVGAYSYDGGDVDEGRAFLYLGSETGLAAEPSWIAEVDQANAYLGYSVSTAGDVNADGYDDVIVGAHQYQNGQSHLFEGGVFVYFGSDTGLAATPGWSAEADQQLARFGYSVSTAGDVNGDGYSDVIVGAPWFNLGEMFEGIAYVYAGSETGLSYLWSFDGDQAFAEFGASVSTAGDVNGDGYSDVVVGAHYYDNPQFDEGKAFLFLGSPSGLSGAVSWTAEGDQESARFGFDVSAAGDVNGDGYADVIVGSPYYNNGEDDEGIAALYLGSSSGLSVSPAWLFEGGQDLANAGVSVSLAGDVNGDGFSDILVGALGYDKGEANEGSAFLFLGSNSGPSLDPAWMGEGDLADAGYGISAGAAGDVDGDGYGDVIIGASGYTNGEYREGAAYVYHGSADGPAATPGWAAYGDQAYANFGVVVAPAGDVNGDGYSDVIVGAPRYDFGGIDVGRAYVYAGSDSGLAGEPLWFTTGVQEGEQLGAAASNAGDVNGDGYSDVIIGARSHDGGEEESIGRASLFLGSAVGLGSTPDWTAEGGQALEGFGVSLATAGDVNGDGYSDVLVGAYGYSGGEQFEGAAYGYYGSETGLSVSPDWSVESDQANAAFGQSVSTAGDVNADGYSDVIVGAAYMSGEYTKEGAAFVYLGSDTGLAFDPGWVVTGEQDSCGFGRSVATAGDVNGDGFSDVIVGAYSYDNGEINEGRSFVFLGSDTGLAVVPDWTGEMDQADAFYGFSVAAAGDVNGDGFGDVVVGAFGCDGIGPDEGKALVYLGSAQGISSSPVWGGSSGQGGSRYGFSVAGAGDVNADGFGDILVGAPYYNTVFTREGSALVYFGNGGDGLDRRPEQAQARLGGTVPIQILGQSDDGALFRLNALGRTPAGRGNVQLEWEVKPLGIPFDGLSTERGLATDTGVPVPGAGSAVLLSEFVPGLANETPYHWRLRIRTDSPYFPHTPWFSPPYNTITETDLRTGTVTSVSDPDPQRSTVGLSLLQNYPNPFNPSTTIRYSLPDRCRVSLSVFDVTGRRVAVLIERTQDAGDHTVIWDGRNHRGLPVASGVYFLRLSTPFGNRSLKILLAK
jgi:hypothetical protein